VINLSDRTQQASTRRPAASRRARSPGPKRFGDLRSWQDVLVSFLALLALSFWAFATR